MLKGIKEFLERAGDRDISTTWYQDGKQTHVKIRNAKDSNLLYNLKTIKRKEVIQIKENSMVLKFEDNPKMSATYYIMNYY